MLDLNNRPGGPNLIVTAKTAHKVHFLDAGTLTLAKTIDMPGSTHELALSADGRTAYGSVYGGGIFTKRINPDRRIVVIDLPSKSLTRVIDLGETYAPHGVMMDAGGRALVLGRARQRGGGDRSGDRQGAADRCRQPGALARHQPHHRQGVRLGQN
jgi:DNA-binding beta-propeller fold protein YncE